jgi:uncharacterized protein GlcG (DUF336 family)
MLTLAQAQQIIAAALAGERSDGIRRVAVAVCDDGAHPVASAREDGAAPLMAHIAQAKAFTCMAYGKPTKLVAEWADGSPNWFQGIGHVAQAATGQGLTGSPGGVIIRDTTGRALGAVGVAGEAGPIDEALACRGIEAAGFVADPG